MNFRYFIFFYSRIEQPPHTQNQSQSIQQPLPPQPNHPTNNCKSSAAFFVQNQIFANRFQLFNDFSIAASNIPSHNVQSHIYPQSQPQFVPNYLPHMGPAGNFYHIAPHIPSLYFSNFTANVNVHGYTQTTMPSPYLPANFVPADSHQSEQVNEEKSKQRTIQKP